MFSNILIILNFIYLYLLSKIFNFKVSYQLVTIGNYYIPLFILLLSFITIVMILIASYLKSKQIDISIKKLIFGLVFAIIALIYVSYSLRVVDL